MPEILTNLYITEQGASLRTRNEMIVCEKDGDEIVSRPLKDVGLVVLFGAVQASTQALLALLENGGSGRESRLSLCHLSLYNFY